MYMPARPTYVMSQAVAVHLNSNAPCWKPIYRYLGALYITMLSDTAVYVYANSGHMHVNQAMRRLAYVCFVHTTSQSLLAK